MKKRIFWGIVCVLGAVALVINKLGYLKEIGVWSILLSALLVGGFINGIIKKSWAKILFSAAFFVIVNDQILHLESLTPWTVLGVAFLGTLGLNMLCPMKHKGARRKWFKESKGISAWSEKDELLIAEDGEVVRQDVVFGNSVKYIKSKELSKIDTDCVFGDVSIYLTEAELKNHRAKICTDVVFGNAYIYVPTGWTVATNIDTVFGKVIFHGNCAIEGEDKLLICGSAVFGDMVVYYV